MKKTHNAISHLDEQVEPIGMKNNQNKQRGHLNNVADVGAIAPRSNFFKCQAVYVGDDGGRMKK